MRRDTHSYYAFVIGIAILSATIFSLRMHITPATKMTAIIEQITCSVRMNQDVPAKKPYIKTALSNNTDLQKNKLAAQCIKKKSEKLTGSCKSYRFYETNSIKVYENS